MSSKPGWAKQRAPGKPGMHSEDPTTEKNCVRTAISQDGDATQWHSACSTCPRPWIPSLVLQSSTQNIKKKII